MVKDNIPFKNAAQSIVADQFVPITRHVPLFSVWSKNPFKIDDFIKVSDAKNKDDIIDSEKFDKTADKYSTVVEIMLTIIYTNKALYNLWYTYQLFLRMTDELTLDEASYYLRSIITVLESSTSENARIIGNAVPPEYARRLGVLLYELKEKYNGTI